jgi:O-antigen/teichoic acid export membrane protein
MLLIQGIKNNKDTIVNIVGSFWIKGLSMVVGLVTVSAYMQYFSDQVLLGVWFTMLSVLHWILTFDVGIGNGLRNHLVRTLVARNHIATKRYISSAYIMVGAILLPASIIIIVLIGKMDLNAFFQVSSGLISSKNLIVAVRISYAGIALQLYLKIVVSILYSLQRTALANSLALLTNILILLFVHYSLQKAPTSDMVLLSTVYALAVNVPLLLATIYVFKSSLKISRPNYKYFVLSYAKEIISIGYKFFAIQIALLIINLTNEIMIARLFSPEFVVEYQVYNKIFVLFLTVFSILTIPIWSLITKAFHENNMSWIQTANRSLNYTALVISTASFIVIIVFQWLVDLWLGARAINIDPMVAVLFAIFYSIMIFIYASNCVANGISYLKPQLICFTGAALLKIPLSIGLVGIWPEWSSIMLANIIIMLPCVVFQPIFIRRRLITVTK